MYDLITSTDNLEHLKNLPEWISLFYRSLKDKGYFLTTCTFRGRGLHLLENHKYDSLAQFVKMMNDEKFILKGQLIQRFGRVFIVPGFVLKRITDRTSGRLLVFQKNV